MKRSLAALGALLVVFRAATAIAGDNSESRVSIEGIGADRQSENFSAEDQTPGPPALFADVLPATGPILDATPTTAPGTRPDASATRPEETSAEAGRFPAPGSTYGLTEFIRHFAPHEPMYFVGGTQSPNVKFQFSIRYRILTPDGPLATDYPWLKGFNIGYTQMSLWDLTSPSAPFFDTSYRPEFFYYMENIPQLHLPEAWQAGFQTGIGHESNGKGGTDSRSLNIVYIRPIVTLTDKESGLFVSAAPKLYAYIGNLDDNPDIAHYRGYADLRFVVGQLDGLQLAALGRVGTSWNRGSMQLDLTYPLTRILRGNADISLDAQYFNGYGESLLTYKQRTSIFRVGLALVR